MVLDELTATESSPAPSPVKRASSSVAVSGESITNFETETQVLQENFPESEQKHVDNFLKDLRFALFKSKKEFLFLSFSTLEEYFRLTTKEQALKFNAKRIGDLRSLVSSIYFRASKFSSKLPDTSLGLAGSVEGLIMNFLQQNFRKNLHLLTKRCMDTAFELEEVDLAVLEEPIVDIFKNLGRVALHEDEKAGVRRVMKIWSKDKAYFSLREEDDASAINYLDNKASVVKKFLEEKKSLNSEYKSVLAALEASCDDKTSQKYLLEREAIENRFQTSKVQL